LLAKLALNPVANMGIGPDTETQNILNITPITSQPELFTPQGEGRINGLGNTTFSNFFSPMAAQSSTPLFV